jgi:hypothetical protein
VQTSLDISAQILEIALVLPVDQGLHYQGEFPVRYIVGHGVKHIPSASEVSLHELRIELISCQAGEGPEDDPFDRSGLLSGKEEKILQSLASHRGGPGPCLIGEYVDQQKVVPVAEFLDSTALGYHTVLLLITSAVAAISPDPVSGLERTFSFRHSH